MGILSNAIVYVQDNPDRFREAFLVHVRLSVFALAAAFALFFPLGVLASRGSAAGQAIVSLVSSARVVPSIAVLFLLFPFRRDIGGLLPFFDRSFTLALVALILLAGPPILINTDAGLRGVDQAVVENARGLGMSSRQAFTRVQLPIALPVVIAGIRTASVEVIASATIAAFVGAGSLGRFITSGLTLLDYRLLLVGAIPITLLALTVEAALAAVQRLVTPPEGNTR